MFLGKEMLLTLPTQWRSMVDCIAEVNRQLLPSGRRVEIPPMLPDLASAGELSYPISCCTFDENGDQWRLCAERLDISWCEVTGNLLDITVRIQTP